MPIAKGIKKTKKGRLLLLIADSSPQVKWSRREYASVQGLTQEVDQFLARKPSLPQQ